MGSQAQPVETDAYAAFAARVVRSLGRRCAEGDVEDLRHLREMRKLIDEYSYQAIHGLRKQGYSLAEIGRGLGITKQGVYNLVMRHEDAFLGADVPTALSGWGDPRPSG